MRNSVWPAIAAAAIVAGCAPMVWQKPGGTQDEFARDRYTCLQESQQRSSGAVVNQFGGAASSTMVTNQGLFGSCMNAHGWYLGQAVSNSAGSNSGSKWNQPGWQPPAGIGANSADDAQRKAEDERRKAVEQADYEVRRARLRLSVICYDDSYRRLFEKGACKAEAVTAAQLADRSKPTPDEIDLMRRYVDEIVSNAAVVAGPLHASGDTFGAQAVDSARDAIVVPARGVIDGSMTWGAYNKQRANALKATSATVK